ncbi:hypothetical protein Scani_37400 [Streptomyces caniferus]|uniref:Uncharacterized protein n=1 Tax=Streptomyces caniferus TaxID=285557 RepID=A0A640SAB0_9ACTN|nr:hypothetical protein Scani_37400 [Streptomyces caniferus]
MTASGRAARRAVAGRAVSAASAGGPVEAATLAPRATEVTPADVDLMNDLRELPRSPSARAGGRGPVAAPGLISSAYRIASPCRKELVDGAPDGTGRQGGTAGGLRQWGDD